jgi:hypothetical protein
LYLVYVRELNWKIGAAIRRQALKGRAAPAEKITTPEKIPTPLLHP